MSLEIFILAGGLSSRMGTDKARLKLGSETLEQKIRRSARQTGLKVRVVRRDLVPRCGPLGGIYTAFKRSNANALLFLACDMPFVSPELLRGLIEKHQSSQHPVFTKTASAGFPFILPRRTCKTVVAQIAAEEFSLKALAEAIDAKLYTVPATLQRDLIGANTPAEWRDLKSSAAKARNPTGR